MTSNTEFNPSVREIVDFANSQEIKTLMVMMDPTLAEQILREKNTGNRPIRGGRILEYSEAMKKGTWVVTHQGIAISRSGVLLDGQHRLLAVVKSGATVPMQVTMNVPDDNFPMIDCGVPRRAFDRLRKPKRHMEVVSFFCELTKVIAGIGVRGVSTPRDPIGRLDHVLRIIEPTLFRFDDVVPKTTVPVISSTAFRAACIYSTFQGAPESYAFGLYKKLIAGDLEDLPPIGIALIRRLLNKDLLPAGLGGSVRNDLFFKVLDVFHPKKAKRRSLPPLSQDECENIRREMREIFK